MNPFKYGQIVTGRDFIGRKQPLADLKAYMKAGQNVSIYGTRRIGKSSLVHEAARQNKTRLLAIDLLEVKSAGDICKRIVSGIISIGYQQGSIETILKKFAGLRPTISLDPVTGMPNIGLDAKKVRYPESISGLMSELYSIHKKNKCVVLFDEFQDVMKIPDQNETLALMRAEIQKHSTLCYVFAGSIRDRMYEIFMSNDSPFYKSALPMELESLTYREFSPSIIKRFTNDKRLVSGEILAEAFEIAGNTTGDIQQLCESLWSVTSRGDEINKSHLRAALIHIWGHEQRHYESILNRITEFQKNCLLAIARIGGEHVSSSAFLEETGSSSAATIKAIGRLTDLKILFRFNNVYYFSDPFFRHWLLAHCV